MQIQQIVIERQNNEEYCGLLFYHHQEQPLYVPWTVELTEQVILKLFPPAKGDGVALVSNHYEEMADAIVDSVLSAR